MRTVAREAGGSVGSLSYRIGDKAALIARLIGKLREDRRQSMELWRPRTAPLDMAVPEVLAQMITAYLDEASTTWRETALVGCEILLDASTDPVSYPGIGGLFDDEDDFWRGLLAAGGVKAADILGCAIAAYCRDEMPFSIAIGANTDYRLLRAATSRRLAEGFAGHAKGLSRSFEALVAACGNSAAGTPLPLDLPDGSKKAELAGYIADIMIEQGLANLSHRLVAARAGIPNSSVAHHFRTHDDLLQAGLGAQILRMRRELHSGATRHAEGRHGMALIRSTHAIALAAARDPVFRPFALDMRRRRAENVHATVSEAIAGADGLDRAAAQAAVIAIIGSGLAAMARGEADERDALGFPHLAQLRKAYSIS